MPWEWRWPVAYRVLGGRMGSGQKGQTQGQEHRAGAGSLRWVLAVQPLSPMTLGKTCHPAGVLFSHLSLILLSGQPLRVVGQVERDHGCKRTLT